MVPDSIANTQLLKYLRALQLPIQLSMLDEICFNLGIKLIKLCRVPIFVID